ncbi:MAG: polyamine aminopropyltransferase [Pseudomonadota bacterium]
MGNETWVTETVNDADGFRTSLKAAGPPRRLESTQDLQVFDSIAFGKVMMLDGAFQITAADEFIYHEMMAHMPLFSHPNAERVLIIGGGDGGIAREALRHPSVTAATLVEIDAAVVALCRSEFEGVSAGAFDDPRLSVVIADGATFVAETDERFDVVIVDSPDPVGAGAVLFTEAFYAGCRRVLRPGGILVTQSGMPFLTPDFFRAHAATLARVFPHRRFFTSTVPSYTGGPMAHGFSSDDPGRSGTATEALAARQSALGLTFRYWTPAIHQAAFALPQYVADLVD